MTGAALAGPFGWKSAWRFRARLALSLTAVAIGVAIGYAVHLINTSAVEEFARGLRAMSGTADLVVRGSRAGLPLDVFVKLARDPLVAVASPVIELDARVGPARKRVSVIGIDALRAGAIAPALLGEASEQLDVLRDDTIFLSATLASELNVQVGGNVDVEVEGVARAFRIAGWLSAQAPEAMLAVIDIAAAQGLSGAYDRISRLDIRLREGVAVPAAIAQFQAQSPLALSIEQPDEIEQASARLSRAYRVNLTVLALMALFTGALLVFSCEALMASRRRAELALLRVLGMTRAEVIRSLLRQSAIVGIAGSIVGLLLGALIASLALRYGGGDLGAGYYRGVQPGLSVSIGAAITFMACGIAAALLGGAMPALDAARVAPARALRSTPDLLGASVLQRTVLRWTSAIAFLVLATLLVRLPPLLDLPLGGYGAIACVLFAALVSLPPLCAWILRLLPHGRDLAFWLVTTRLRRAPLEASISLAAMVAAVSLTVAMAIMVGSFRGSLLQWLDRLLPADLYLRSTGADDRPRLGAADQTRIAATSGVRSVEFLRMEPVMLDPSRPRVSLLARDVDRSSIAERLPLLERRVAIPAGVIPVWPSEVAAGLYGLRVGQTMALPLAGAVSDFAAIDSTARAGEPASRLGPNDAARAVFIAGIWRDYGRPQGAIVIERSQYIALTGDRAADDAAIWFERDEDAARVTESLAWLGSQVLMATPGEIKRASVQIFDRTFAVTYALEAVAVLIGVAGLSAGISASVAMRRKELGMLRHFGLSRAQLMRLLVGEGVALSGVGAIVGSVTGVVLSWILIEVVNRQSFHWGMDMHWPVGTLIGFIAALIGVAALAAALSARRVMGEDLVRSVREDW